MAKNTFERTINFIMDNPDKNGKISSYNSEIISMSIDLVHKKDKAAEREWATIESGLMQITDWDGVEHKISRRELFDYVFIEMKDKMAKQ